MACWRSFQTARKTVENLRERCSARAANRGSASPTPRVSILYFFCSGRHRGQPCPQRYVLASKVEKAVERFYGTIQLEPERVEEVRAIIRTLLATARERMPRKRSARGCV